MSLFIHQFLGKVVKARPRWARFARLFRAYDRENLKQKLRLHNRVARRQSERRSALFIRRFTRGWASV